MLFLVAGACARGGPSTATPSTTPSTSTTTSTITTEPASTAPAYRVAAAGDIACKAGQAPTASTCQMGATADVVASIHPDAVLPLGDLQYDLGKDFEHGYATTWGRFEDITRPVVGNHEYTGGKAAGYFGYFGAAAHPPDGWYSFDTPTGWHVVVLNSVCAAVGGCGEGSRQYDWLRADLDATTHKCILAAWHHPRWSSGLHHSDATYEPFWRLLAQHGADLVLSGHDHHYERFAPKDGVVQYVVGTGGRSLYPVLSRESGSQVTQDAGFGVLELDLADGSYSTTYRPVAGFDFSDSFSADCQ